MTSKSNVISIGSQVVLDLIDRGHNKERLKVIIVKDESADYGQGYIGANTPLAKAILGEQAGITIPYLQDDILGIEILSVAQPVDKPPEDLAAKRAAKMKKTTQEVEDTNAIVFASSFSGKWGDYDPDSITKDKKPEDKS